MAGVNDIKLGGRYGRLVVQERSTVPAGKSRNVAWLCICDCGQTIVVDTYRLLTGNTRSCGCLYKDTRHTAAKRHGLRYQPEYSSWYAMKRRCDNPNNDRYKHYGGRGIKVCDEWLNDFERFYRDMGPKPTPSHSIDRKDTDGDYTPDNCCWATPVEQRHNQRRMRHAA